MSSWRLYLYSDSYISEFEKGKINVAEWAGPKNTSDIDNGKFFYFFLGFDYGSIANLIFKLLPKYKFSCSFTHSGNDPRWCLDYECVDGYIKRTEKYGRMVDSKDKDSEVLPLEIIGERFFTFSGKDITNSIIRKRKLEKLNE